jgi:hypothetical protein
MTWLTCASSNVSAFARDGAGLVVQFRGGGVYRYDDVPSHVVEGLISAESKGSFLYHNVIKSAPLKSFRKLSTDEAAQLGAPTIGADREQRDHHDYRQSAC